MQLDYYYGQRYADLHDYVNNGAWDIIDCPANLSFFKVKLRCNNHVHTHVVKINNLIKYQAIVMEEKSTKFYLSISVFRVQF